MDAAIGLFKGLPLGVTNVGGVDLLLSASYVPKSGSAGERLLELLRTLHEQYADASGFVTLIYETEVFCSNKLFAGPPRE